MIFVETGRLRHAAVIHSRIPKLLSRGASIHVVTLLVGGMIVVLMTGHVLIVESLQVFVLWRFEEKVGSFVEGFAVDVTLVVLSRVIAV